MKKTVRFIALAVVPVIALMLAPLSFGQIVENPAKPKAANAGRVIVPQEVVAISDEGTSDYFFNWPRSLRAGPDGSLLLTDKDQVLQFDAKGMFLRNLFKKGQGPGEMPYPGTPLAAGKSIVVFSGSPGKLVYFSPSGLYEKEIAVRAEGRTSLSLIGYQAGRFYFESWEFPRTTGDPDFVDNPRTIVAVNEADGTIKRLTSFVTRAWVITSPSGGGGMFTVTSLIAVPFRDDLLALAHTEEYLVKIFDPAADKIVREFRRSYARVKGEPLTEAEKKGGIILNGKPYSRPELKFENDVKNILTRDERDLGGHVDEGQGQGRPRRCLRRRRRLPGLLLAQAPRAGPGKRPVAVGQCALDGDFLWVVERSEDETFSHQEVQGRDLAERHS